MVPGEVVQFGMARGRIGRVRRNSRAPSAGYVESPMHVARTHGDVAEIVFAEILHCAPAATMLPRGRASSKRSCRRVAKCGKNVAKRCGNKVLRQLAWRSW